MRTRRRGLGSPHPNWTKWPPALEKCYGADDDDDDRRDELATTATPSVEHLCINAAIAALRATAEQLRSASADAGAAETAAHEINDTLDKIQARLRGRAGGPP